MPNRPASDGSMEDRLLTSDLLKLVQDMTLRFGPNRRELISARSQRGSR